MSEDTEGRSPATALPAVDPVAPPPEETAAESAGGLAARLASIGELPEEVLAFLVRTIPARELWKWLGHDDRFRLLGQIAKGFQQNPRALQQPPVRKRLEHHLVKTPDDTAALIELWSEASPDAVNAVRETEAGALPAALPALWRRFGGEAVLLALLAANADDEAFEAYLGFDTDAAAAPATAQDAGETGAEEPAPPTSPEAAALSVLLAAQQERDSALEAAQNARKEAQAAGERARALAAEMATLRTHSSREVQHATADARKNERRATEAETALAETKKLLDRTGRRQRHAETERDELAVENKRLKKQLRQAQQIQEELRKQISSANAHLQKLAPRTEPEEAAPAPPETGKTAKTKPSPADTTFVWVSDGRRFAVTPREVARAVNTNDEDFVFRLIQSFESLAVKNDEGFKLFRKSVRDLGPYYEHVLTRDTTRVLVDASNVVRYETDSRGRGRFDALLQIRDDLRRRDCFPITLIADASLRHFVDKPNELATMAARGELIVVDKGVEADEILAREARRTGAYVVTNDRSFHLKVSPDFEPPRITFRFLGGLLVVDEF